MADEVGRLHQRFVVDGATLEFQVGGGLFRRGAAQTGHVLNFGLGGIQVLCSNQVELKAGDRLDVTIHLRDKRNWLKGQGEVRWCREVPGRPFKRVGVRLADLAADQLAEMRDMEQEYLPIQDGETKGQTGRLIETYKLPPETAVRDVAAAKSAEATRFKSTDKKVQRPVALLELIALLDQFDVKPQLVLAVLESVQQGVTVEDLFVTPKPQEEARPRRRVVEEKPKEEAKPMPVYRLDGKTPLHFNDEGVPITPPAEHLFFTRFKDPTAFACELTGDRMVQENGSPSFKGGDILVFVRSDKVESGSFIFIQTKEGPDEFTQVFIGKDEHVRLRPLNGAYPERAVRRADVRLTCKLIARLERVS
jgi:hypothetical protein